MRVPGLLVGRASVSGAGDDHLLLASVSDGDVVADHERAVRAIDGIADVSGSVTWWGEVLKQDRALASGPADDLGFILGSYAGRDRSLRESQITATANALVAMEDVQLVARTRGSADILVIYTVDGTDMPTTLARANAIQRVLDGHELDIEVEGIAMAMASSPTG
jgi:hypothetical protein